MDADSDTKIQVEESADDDTIRFDTAGVERATISSTGLTLSNGRITANGFSTDGDASYNADRISFSEAQFYVLNGVSVGVKLDNGQTNWSTQSDIRLNAPNLNGQPKK